MRFICERNTDSSRTRKKTASSPVAPIFESLENRRLFSSSWYAISIDNPAGRDGSSKLTSTGSLQVDATKDLDGDGVAVIQASSAAEAVRQALTGSITTDRTPKPWYGDVRTFYFPADGAFRIAPKGHRIGYEDLYGLPRNDGDYNDHHWAVQNTRLPTITLTALTDDAYEAGPDGPVSQTFIITRDIVTQEPLTIHWMLGGTAISGQDFDLAGNQLNLNGTSGTVVIPAGKAKTTIVVKPLDDRDVEGDETIELSLSFDANRLHLAGRASYEVGSADAGSGKIISDDADPTEYLIAFYGAGPAGFGNEWLENIAKDVSAPQGYDLGLYGSESKGAALEAYFGKLDIDQNKFISAHEIEQQTVRVVGYSRGGVEAVYFTRDLTKRSREGYRLHSPIPVAALVTIDPVTIAKGTNGPLTNVQTFVNYYQRKGGTSTITLLDRPTQQPVGTVTHGNWFSELLKGSKLGNGGTQIQVENDPAWMNRKAAHFYDLLNDGELLGKDVNHDTMPWYVYEYAIQDLT